MTTIPSAEQFVDALKTRFEVHNRGWGHGAELVAAGVDSAGGAVIIYREMHDGPVVGRRYVVSTYALLFDPTNGPEELADIALSDDIFTPSGHGSRESVPWAEGLVEDPESVGWIGSV